MSRIAVFFAEGYEEIEALTVVDLCRRAGIDTLMVSVTGAEFVTGSHAITVKMDCILEQLDFEEVDMLVLPGGKPGTDNLEANTVLMDWVTKFYESGKNISAICAAPSILGHRGYLKDRNACSYPDYESHLTGARVSCNPVEFSDHIITSRGMGSAMEFGLAIIERFQGKAAADKMAHITVFR